MNQFRVAQNWSNCFFWFFKNYRMEKQKLENKKKKKSQSKKDKSGEEENSIQVWILGNFLK